jgi:hypothetical protein
MFIHTGLVLVTHTDNRRDARNKVSVEICELLLDLLLSLVGVYQLRNVTNLKPDCSQGPGKVFNNAAAPAERVNTGLIKDAILVNVTAQFAKVHFGASLSAKIRPLPDVRNSFYQNIFIGIDVPRFFRASSRSQP